VTPMLPLADPESFVERIVAFQPDVLVTQDFQRSGGAYGASTGAVAEKILRKHGWTSHDYRQCVARLKQRVATFEGECGFFPPMARILSW